MQIFNKLNNLIDNLLSVPGTKDKEMILSGYADDKDIAKFLSYVYDDIKFLYNKKKFDYKGTFRDIDPDDNIMNQLYMILDMLDGGIRGKMADQIIDELLDCSPRGMEVLLDYAFKRKITNSKVGKKMIDSIFPGLIKVAPYQRCEQEKMLTTRISEEDYTSGNVIVQTKADGLFINISILKDGIEATTRYGRSIPKDDFFDKFDIKEFQNNVLHGEMLVKGKDDKVLPREIGNGLINSYFKRNEITKNLKAELDSNITDNKRKKLVKELEDKEAEWRNTKDNMLFKIWDTVNLEDFYNLKSDVPYSKRFKQVHSYVTKYKLQNNENTFDSKKTIELIDYKIVYSFDSTMDFYNQQLKDGEEGAVVKKYDSIWKHDVNRSGIIKLKDFKDCDLIVVGYNPGKPGTKYADGIGSLQVESSDGLIKLDLSGLSDLERGFERVDITDSSKGIKLMDGFDCNQYLGMIVAVKFSYVIGEGPIKSLYLPSLIEIRDLSDKSVADDSAKIINQ